MATPKKLYDGLSAREKILKGIINTTDLVSKTLGPRGKLVVVAKGTDPRTTKDGISVIKEIGFSDPLENVGAQLVKEASHKVAYLAGDGTTSTAVLVRSMCEAAASLMKITDDVAAVRETFERSKNIALGLLDDYVKKVSSDDDVEHVARVSANDDSEIAKNVLEAFKGIGDDGIVALADSMSRKGLTDVSFSSGLEVDAGYSSTMFANGKGETCEMTDPLVLLCWKPIHEFDDLKPFIEYAHEKRKPLAVIAPDFSEEVVAICATNASKKVVEMCLIYTPGNQKTDKEDLTKDIAALLGAEILGETKTAEEWLHSEHFGSCGQINVNKARTIFAEARHDDEKFEAYLETLREKIKQDDSAEALSEYEIEKIKQRLAHLSGGVATIRVGGLTTQEQQEKKDRYEDAICAVRAAMGEGILPGAGVPLYKIAHGLRNQSASLDSVIKREAMEAYASALRSVFDLLADRKNIDYVEVVKHLWNNKKSSFDVRTDEVVADAFDVGIVDPYKVVKLSVIYATGVAITFLQIGGGITHDAANLSYERIDPLQEDGGMIDVA